MPVFWSMTHVKRSTHPNVTREEPEAEDEIGRSPRPTAGGWRPESHHLAQDDDLAEVMGIVRPDVPPIEFPPLATYTTRDAHVGDGVDEDFPHGYPRKASTGSTRAARRAGRMLASSAVATSRIAATANVSGSRGAT